MALSEAEELELLELEEAEAQEAGQTPPESNPPAVDPHAGDSKAKRFTRKVANALPIVGGIGVPAVAALGTSGLSLPATAGLAGIGAAGGTAAKQLILRALGDTEGVPNTPMEAAKDIGVTGATDAALTFTGGKFLKGAGKLLKTGKDLVMKPGAAEVAQAGKDALVKVGERGAEKLALARTTKEAAKKGLIEAEEKAGLHFSSTPGFEDMLRDPKKMAEFTQRIGRLSKQGPEELARSVPSEQLQLFRKIAQEGEKISSLSDIAKSEMRHGKDVFTQALGMKEKGMGEALGKFRDADKVLGEIPGEIKNKLLKTKALNEKELLSAKSLDKKRKVVKGLLKATAYGLGAKAILK